MKKSFVVLIHVGFWACYFLMVFIALGLYYRSNHSVILVVNAFKSILLFAFIPSCLSYFLYYFFLFPRYLQHKKIFLSIINGLIISVASAVTGYILIRYFIESGLIIDMDEGGKNGRSTAPTVIIVMTLIGIICGIVAWVIKGFITWFNEIKLKDALKEKTYQMEMALIKSQLDPHLLFNTINNIDALILKDAAAASDYLNKLSDIMRFMLYETKPSHILLSKEIEYIEKYIALQKIRTTNKEYVRFTVSGNVGSKHIAPMIFIPFIENAFKHTNNKKLAYAISIDICVKAQKIVFTCENKFDAYPSARQPDSGLGNELIQKRLHLIYPQKHSLVVNKTDDLYSVNLSINNG